MENQKLDNTLQLALSLGQAQSGEESGLYDGYDRENDRWELIVKYNGSLERYRTPEITVEELIAGYAIVTLPAEQIDAFSAIPLIEYVEKPQKILPQITESLSDACFRPNVLAGEQLTGRGIRLAVIDSGIDYTWDVFRTRDGKSRIAWIYDQQTGRLIDREAINESLEAYDASTGMAGMFKPLVTDTTGHGTGVAAIALSGAPECELVAVRLAPNNPNGFILTTNLMRAVDYVVKGAQADRIPVAVNISYGNSYGSHDGTSLLERFLDNAAQIGRNVICVGMGNEGAGGGHFSGRLPVRSGEQTVVSFAVSAYERKLSLQIWSYPSDRFEAQVISPAGERYRIQNEGGTGEAQSVVLGGSRLDIFAGTAKPYQAKREIYLSFSARGQYLDGGIWQIELTCVRVKNGFFQMYLPAEEARTGATRFLYPDPYATVTIPATAQKVISVGAYSARYKAYASFSGRGMYGGDGDRAWQIPKPDLAAPGVNILLENKGMQQTFTGTSFATPFVTAAAALLMQWGIGDGNDPYLYGEKVKAYLQSGAQSPGGGGELPDALTGWGTLCVRGSFPDL